MRYSGGCKYSGGPSCSTVEGYLQYGRWAIMQYSGGCGVRWRAIMQCNGGCKYGGGLSCSSGGCKYGGGLSCSTVEGYLQYGGGLSCSTVEAEYGGGLSLSKFEYSKFLTSFKGFITIWFFS